MYYQEHEIRFKCTGCGDCCTGCSDAYVHVGPARAEQIREYLGLSWAWFRRRYLCRLSGGEVGIQLGRNGRCPFLLGAGNCRIYPVRPAQCRSYPFWPEIVSSRHGWRQEARRCEGIGCGPVISKAKIERAIKLSQQEE